MKKYFPLKLINQHKSCKRFQRQNLCAPENIVKRDDMLVSFYSKQPKSNFVTVHTFLVHVL
jgi:hypothetical protein